MTVTEQEITKQALKTAVAQICLTIGWNSIHQTPLNILVDVLHKYIQTIGRISHGRSELYGRNDPNILDLALTFDDMGVNLPDLEEFVQHIEVAPSKEVPPYPAPAQDNLNHLRPGSKEVLHRPLHVYDYLPPMYPEMEEVEAEDTANGDTKEAEEETGNMSQVSTPNSKRPRVDAGLTPKQSDDGCPLREISSVMMTAGGFLSPCREGKLPERGKVPVPDPEERRTGARRHLEEADRSSGEFQGTNIKQEPGTGLMPAVNIKQEVSEDLQDYDKMITPQEIHGRGKKVGHDGSKANYTSGENIEVIMDAVIERGIRETSRHGGSVVDYSDGDADVEMGEPAKPVVVKTEGEKRGRKKAPVVSKKQDSPDLFSAPQHFTANAKTPPKKKMSRIPKITEKVTLPSPSSLMSGLQNPAAAAMANPLIPNFGMNLYGFGNIPASMIPGMMNPSLMAGAMAMMQQAAAASQANTSRDGGSDSAVTLDSELEEGEISPPDTPVLPAKIKKEVDEEAVRKEEEKRREEEQLRKEEKEREAEIARKKEKERLEKEQEKQRQEERKKLLLLSQERDRLKKLEEEREKEKREKMEKLDKLEKEKPKDPEKEKKKSKKEKKDKDRDKSKKDKKKEKKEKKKMKEKERNKPDEPQLFAPITPVLKIKPMEAPTAESPSTPKLVIKNIPKNPPTVKEEPAVPVLGFQPLRHGPARTPKPSAAKIEKKAKRPSGDQAHTPGPSSAKKPREKPPKVKSKKVIEADSDDNTPGIITETVGSYEDGSGNKIWICPACGKQDDGSPMIGCDNCDDWYHWLCVGIKSEPGENQDWFCTRCVAKKQGLYLDGGASSKKKK